MKHNRTHISEAFDFNNIKDNGPTRRVVQNALNTLFEDDIIVAEKAAVRNAIQAYIKTIRKYDDSNNIYFTYSDENNILQIKIVDPSKIIRFMINPAKKMIAKMFNAGMPAPKVVFKFKNDKEYDLNICISSGLSVELMATEGRSLTFYIDHGLYILGLDRLNIDKLILERIVLNNDDIDYLYTLDVKNIETPKSRFTGVTYEINYSEFKNFPNISFKNNQGNTPNGLHKNEIR